MATYTAKAPDGRVYKVTAPAGTPPEQIQAYIQEQTKKGAPPIPKRKPLSVYDRMEAISGNVINGALPNVSENVDGAVSALGNVAGSIWNGSKYEPGKAFSAGAKASRDRLKRFNELNPRLANAAGWTGFAASLIAAPELKVMRAVKPLKAVAARGAQALTGRVPAAVIAKATVRRKAAAAIVNSSATGAAYGGVAGGLQGEGTDRIRNAVTGAVAGGVLGAVAIPAVQLGSTATKRIARVAAPYIAPSLAARVATRNAERRVGGALESAYTPAEAADEIVRRAPSTPAMPADLTDESRKLLGYSSRGMGPGQSAVLKAVTDRQANASSRVQSNISEALGPTVDPYAQSQMLTDKGRADAAPFYDEAYTTPITVTPKLRELLDTPLGQSSIEAGKGDIINTPASLRNVGSETPTKPGITWDPTLGPEGAFRSGDVPVTEAWDGAKRNLDNIVSDGENRFVPSSGGSTTNTRPAKLQREQLLSELDAQNPAFAMARAKYEGPVADRDAFMVGRSDAGPNSIRTTVPDAKAQMRGMTESQLAQFRLGDRSLLSDVVGGRPRFADPTTPLIGNDTRADLIREVHGAEAADRLADLVANERDAHLTYKEVFGNSMTPGGNTMGNGLGEQALDTAGGALAKGRFWPAVGSLAVRSWQGRIGNFDRDVKAEMGRILTETKPNDVASSMAAIQARADKDATFAARLKAFGAGTGKIGSAQIVGRSGDDTGMYEDRE